MRILRFLFVLFLISSASAYPQHEIANILDKKYPDAINNETIILQDDGNGVYIRYSIYPIPNSSEMEILWQQVQVQRNATAIETAIANRIKQNYTQAMVDLDTIQSGNPSFTQAGFNQVVWAQKREADILQDILRFLKWYF